MFRGFIDGQLHCASARVANLCELCRPQVQTATRSDVPAAVQVLHAIARAHGCSLRQAQHLLTWAVSPDPYTEGLRRRGLLRQEPASEVEGDEPPRPYDLALQRRGHAGGR
jgi:hypothetical protein